MKRRRRLFWIAPDRQRKFILQLVWVSLFCGWVTAVSLYGVVWMNFRALETLGLRSIPGVRQAFLMATLQLTVSYLIFQFLLIAFMVWVGKKISHRIAGPLYAIGHRIRGMKLGDFQTPFRIRKRDFFHTLNSQFEIFRLHIQKEEKHRTKMIEDLSSLVKRIESPQLRDRFEHILHEKSHDEAA